MTQSAEKIFKYYTGLSLEENKLTEKAMIEFARFHVEAALKATIKKMIKKVSLRHYEDEIDKDEILNKMIKTSYPLNNIK